MIRTERDGAVTALVLNRPERRNAMNEETIRGLHEGIGAAEADPDCRCLILRGEGEHFCAGRDISGKVSGKELEAYLAFDDLYIGMFEGLRRMTKPSVAVVRATRWPGASPWPWDVTSCWRKKAPSSALWKCAVDFRRR